MKLQKPLKINKIIDADNIVPLLDEEDRVALANKIIEGYENDKMARHSWLTKTNEYLKMANCDVSSRQLPWPGASNVCLPTMSRACLTAASRLYAELLRNKYPVQPTVLGISGLDLGEKQQEDAIKEHMLYQLRIDPKSNWEQDLYTLCYLYYVTGTVARYKYYDEVHNCFKFKTLWPEDWCISEDACDMNYARFSFTEKISLNELIERINAKEYETSDVLDSMLNDEASDRDKYESRELIKQFVRLDLDQDGTGEPYCALVDSESLSLLKLTKNFYVEENMEVDEEGNAAYSSPQFEYDDAGNIKKVIKLDAVPYIQIYKMYDNLDGGFYKFGMAHYLYSINKAQNALMNQILDIGTLQARQGAFIDQRAMLPGGTRSLALNQSMFVKPPPGLTLKDAISPFPRSEISPVQYQMLEYLKLAGDETANLTEIMTGQVPDNTSPIIGMSAIQNSLLPFKTSFRLFLTAYSEEMASLAYMNYLYLDDNAFELLNNNLRIPVTRDMYNPILTRVRPSADPIISSDTERYYQQAILDSIMDRPEINARAVLERKLRVADLDEAIQTYMAPPPDPNAPPPPEVQQIMATTEVLKAQAQQAMADIPNKQQELEIKRLEAEAKIDKERREVALQADKEMSEQVLRNSTVVKNIAVAEAQEAGTQLEMYMAKAELLKAERENDSDE